MMNIYYLFTLVLVAIGSAYVSRLYPRVKTWFLNVINKKRNETNRRIEQLELRVDLHTKKDGTYLHKFDVQEVQMEELQEQINNIAEKLSRREQNRKSWLRTEVKNYLKELQK